MVGFDYNLIDNKFSVGSNSINQIGFLPVKPSVLMLDISSVAPIIRLVIRNTLYIG